MSNDHAALTKRERKSLNSLRSALIDAIQIANVPTFISINALTQVLAAHAIITGCQEGAVVSLIRENWEDLLQHGIAPVT